MKISPADHAEWLGGLSTKTEDQTPIPLQGLGSLNQDWLNRTLGNMFKGGARPEISRVISRFNFSLDFLNSYISYIVYYVLR